MLRPKVLIITTGGTIAEGKNEEGKLVPLLSGEALIDILEEKFQIRKLAEIEIIRFCNEDSSQLSMNDWEGLSELVSQELEKEYDGIVITHGTDTLVEAAYFLDLTIDSKKSVVFVGAQRPATDPYSDGPTNLKDAILQVISHEANWGVTITMNQMIHDPRYVDKTHTFNVNGFDSGDKGYLGQIFLDRMLKVKDKLSRIHLPIIKPLAKVGFFSMYSGATGSEIYFQVDNEKIEGLVVEGFGLGNVNENVYHALKYAISKGVKVVLTSRIKNEMVYPIYGCLGGGVSLQDIGVIFGSDLTGPKARIALTLLLSLGSDNLQEEYNSL
ncbi:MAG: asparaginase [Fusobacteria bacterium]|nr:asparaginase [Fusobacteriota bacterium]